MIPDGATPADAPTMLEHPVYVYWCASCGLECEEPEVPRRCACGGRFERFQRVLEIPDGDCGSALSLQSLRLALAEVASSSVAGAEPSGLAVAAALFSHRGPDPQVMADYPTFAAQLAALEVPPPVQRALVQHGFHSFERICTALECAEAPAAEAWALELGLPPAAEVLLRRLWHAAAEARAHRAGAALHKRQGSSEMETEKLLAPMEADEPCLAPAEAEALSLLHRAAPRKRLRIPIGGAAEALARELALESWQLRSEDSMQAIEDEG